MTNEKDPLLKDAAKICIENDQGSVSLVQRKLRIGYNRAGRLIDQLEALGIVSSPDYLTPREVLVNSIQEAEILINKI